MSEVRIDVSDKVLCDDCDRLFTAQSPETGGMLVQSKALCPTCADKWAPKLAQYDEMHLIRDYAQEGERFYDAVMRWRAGNNTVIITGSTEFVDDMEESFRKRLAP